MNAHDLTAASAKGSGPVDNGAGEFRFGYNRAIDRCFASHFIKSGPASDYVDFEPELIPRYHRTPEPAVVDPGKINQLRLPVFVLAEQKDDANLGQSFDDQYARHDRMLREMPGEKRFVDGYVLYRDHAAETIRFQHAVHQEKRVAVRQDIQNFADLLNGKFAGFHSFSAGPESKLLEKWVWRHGHELPVNPISNLFTGTKRGWPHPGSHPLEISLGS
jgi:hypothetical protein